MSTEQSTIQLPSRAARAWRRPASPWPRMRGDRLPGWVLERQGRLALGGLVLAGVVIALSAANTVPLLPQSIQLWDPPWLRGAFGRAGIDLGLGGMIMILTMMFVAYALVVRATSQLSMRTVVIAIAVLHGLVLLAPPLLSNDVFSYIAYGRIGRLYHSNPYVHGPNVIALDKVYPYIEVRWINTPTDYGPLFTALSYLLAPLTIAANVIGYKLIAALSSLAVVWFVWKCALLRGIDPVKAIALVGLNPVMVVFGVGGGHNDMLMLAMLMAGVYVLLLEKEGTGGALMVAASAIKLTGGLLLPFAVASRDSGGPRSPRRLLAGVLLAALGAAALSFGLFGTGPFHLLNTLRTVQSQGGVHSIPGLLLSVVGLSSLIGPVALILDVGVIGCIGWLLVQVYRGRLDWITGAAWATVALLLTAALLLPWYVGWLVPLAALSDDRRLLIATILLTGLGLTTL